MGKQKQHYKFEWWFSLRLRHSTCGSGTSILLRLCSVGVLLSLFVMLISVSVSSGFKREVSLLAYSQTGHISLYPSNSDWLNTDRPFRLTPRLRRVLAENPDISAYYPWLQKRAMLKTKENYTGVQLLGLDSGQLYPYFLGRMEQGDLPSISLSGVQHHPIVLPSHLASVMRCRVGDKVQLYFLQEAVRVRSFQIVGIYASSGLEQMPVLCSAQTLRMLDRMPSDQYYHRISLDIRDDAPKDWVVTQLVSSLSKDPDILEDQRLQISKAEELMPELFSWLELLDNNIYILLGLMLLVGGFSMISGLLILVLDKTSHIGLLKAVGAKDGDIRRVFVLLSLHLAVKAMLIANTLFAVTYMLQNGLHILRLDPKNYYVSFVPMYLSFSQWLGINLLTIAIILLVLLLPSKLASKISPIEAMKFE